MGIEEKARELAEVILDSEIYNRYLQAREFMIENPELFAKVNEYRKRNFYIQNSPDINKPEELRKLLEEFDSIINNKSVREYLDSELILCRTMKKVNNILVEQIDLDIDFL